MSLPKGAAADPCIVLLGGFVDLNWMAAVGPETVDAWRNLRFNPGIVGSCGFDPLDIVIVESLVDHDLLRPLRDSGNDVVIAE